MQSETMVPAETPTGRPLTIRTLWALLVASVAGPALILALFAVTSYRDEVAASRAALQTQVDVLYEHTLRVFDLHRIVVERVRAIVELRRGNERAIHAELQHLAATLAPLSSLWVLRADGGVLATSVVHPVPSGVNLSDRDYFRALRDDPARDLFISEVGRGRVDRALFFTVAVPMRDAEGRFDGLIAVSSDPGYFSEAFPRLLRDSRFDLAGLLRDDGAILARHPVAYPAAEPPFPRLPPDSGLMTAIGRQPDRGAYVHETWSDDVTRSFAYRRIESLPLYVVVARSTADVNAVWGAKLAGFLPAWGIATLALVAATLFALRNARREQRTLDALRDEMQRRDRAEEALRRTQRFEAMGQLTGGVAHDFNNVLQGIGGCLAALDPHIPQGPARGMFEAARRSVERGAGLTRSLLAFARRQVLAPEPTDIGDMLDGMRPLLERTLGGLIRVDIAVPPDLPAALVDRAGMESAILNLAINARDAMPAGGLLTLRAREVRVGDGGDAVHPPDLAPGRYVAVMVEDTGIGMDDATLARAFEPFFTTKEVGRGSGLGLPMVHGMAAQLGGGVHIASAVGRGTTVTVCLPCATTAPAPATVAPPVPAPDEAKKADEAGGGERVVLLVDDDAVIRVAMTAVLEMAGFRVREAGEGTSALALLRDHPDIGALVTDYAMPGMTGAVLAREARRLRPGLPVLVITGYAEAPDGIDCDGLLQKPFRPPDLTARLGALLDRQAASGTVPKP
ncbi:ATP-binding protein [Azospirillum halopraeferens]|uniref:ATP-binding protein n=1 Tax=Azospirillum halopraeferens TaxID=34010 RepID=UPI0003FC15AF|nr:ATP-binding protein [Azospirillum halopraeferens]